MRYLVALLISSIPFAIHAADKLPTRDELLIQAWEKGPASAEDYAAGIRRAFATSTHARLVVDIEDAVRESYHIDECTFLSVTDLEMLRELADQLEFDSSKLPQRDPENPELVRLQPDIQPEGLCHLDYTIVLFRDTNIAATVGFYHAVHIRAQDFTDRVEFPEILANADYYFTKTSSEKVHAWEEKYHIKDLVKSFVPKQNSARLPATKK